MLNPRTPKEWQDAVDAAYLLLQIDSARQYGLITGGPLIDTVRCRWTLLEGAKQGVAPGGIRKETAK